jgi:hypothetical protein
VISIYVIFADLLRIVVSATIRKYDSGRFSGCHGGPALATRGEPMRRREPM